MKLWKTLKLKDGVLRSEKGSQTWKIGKWYRVNGPLAMCLWGYHASRNIIDAMGYVTPDAVAEVEVRGGHVKQKDKQCWRAMRVLRAWKWTKADGVSLAVYAAELVIGIFEKQCPDDKRPRLAIEAAKAWLKNPRKTTYAAHAADAAAAAADAAAAYAAYAAHAAAAAADAAAAYAAYAAYAAAAYAAHAYAAYAAHAADAAADGSATLAKCHRFAIRRLRAKKEMGR